MDKNTTITRRQLTGLMIALAIEYILGVILSTVINYNPAAHSTTQTVVLVTHIVVATAILIGALIRMVVSVRTKSLVTPSAIGLLAVLGSWASGDAASKSGSDVATLIMALCFAIAIAAYGYSLFKLRAM